MTILIWNVRGLNRPSMQSEIRRKIKSLNLHLIILLETRIKQASLNLIANSIVPNGWMESSNMTEESSARIWIIWNPRLIQVTISSKSTQCMHCEINYGNVGFFLSACYGFNSYIQRKDLWNTLIQQSKSISAPWIVTGDFNTIRWPHEKSGGAIPRANGLIDFNDCIQEAGLMDLQLKGYPFTWSNSSTGDSRIESKLDRALINAEFLQLNPLKGDVLLPGISDHAPLFFTLFEKHHIKAPFRYYNYWAKMPGFFQTVNDAWSTDVNGTPLYKVIKKLGLVKQNLIAWKNSQSSIPIQLKEAYATLEDLQNQMMADSGNVNIQEQERKARIQLDHLLKAEESKYKQRSRDMAVNLGDSNTKYFYRLMRKRQNQAYISQIADMEGTVYTDPPGIAAAFVSHFQKILAPKIERQSPDLSHVTPHGYVNEEDAHTLMKPITKSEIEEAIKSANPNKAPGPDGFNAHFFKVCWPIIGQDVCDGIMAFFKHGYTREPARPGTEPVGHLHFVP